MWSYKVLEGFRGCKYIVTGNRGVKYFIVRCCVPTPTTHAIRRYQVLNSLHIINNNNHENVKYAATKIVNKTAIVKDWSGFLDKKLNNLISCVSIYILFISMINIPFCFIWWIKCISQSDRHHLFLVNFTIRLKIKLKYFKSNMMF